MSGTDFPFMTTLLILSQPQEVLHPYYQSILQMKILRFSQVKKSVSCHTSRKVVELGFKTQAWTLDP